MSEPTPPSICTNDLDRYTINQTIRQLANDYEQGLINLEELSREIVNVNAIAESLKQIDWHHNRVERLAADLNRKTVQTLNGG